MKLLIVVDMQKDFVDGVLGTAEAVAILPAVREKIMTFDGLVWYTRDTHRDDYLKTQEGQRLPVPHCIEGSEGWQIHPALEELPCHRVIDKPTFGSLALAEMLVEAHRSSPWESITLIGLCTDICVISNAMLIKAALPEVSLTVDAACCAGVTPDSHRAALTTMQMCQIDVI